MFCRSCGVKIPDDSRFCPQCGEKVVTIADQESKSSQKPKSKYGKTLTILGKYQVNISPDLDKYNLVRRVLEQYASIQQKRAYDFAIENVDNFDDVYKIMLPACWKIMIDYAELTADLFKRVGLDSIDAGTLIQKSMTKSEYDSKFPNITEAMDEYEEMLDSGASELMIEQFKDEAYYELDVPSECANGIYSVCCKIMDFAIDVFIAAKLIPDVQFDSKTARENYKAIVRSYENSRISEAEAIKNLCRCIELEPYHLWFPTYIFKINPKSESDILALCDFLGIKEQVEVWIQSIKQNPDEIPGF